eukprot:364963-Chlamydomonas_euryale.AAC.14
MCASVGWRTFTEAEPSRHSCGLLCQRGCRLPHVSERWQRSGRASSQPPSREGRAAVYATEGWTCWKWLNTLIRLGEAR